jgi:hypothetical protein
MATPNVEIAVAGTHNKNALNTLLPSRLAARNRKKNKIAKTQNKGVNRIPVNPPAVADNPVAFEVETLRMENMSPGANSATNIPARALTIPRIPMKTTPQSHCSSTMTA